MKISLKRMMPKSTMLVALGTMVILGAGSLALAEKASAHGYLEAPASRAYKCKLGENKGCGAVQYEPQSIEVPGQYPTGGPADGQLAGGGIFNELDVQTADRWSKVTMNGGKNTFKWWLTANHATKNWQYYITKKGWDPNKPLTRADFEQVGYFDDKGARPAKDIAHTIDLPTDRSGYHVVLAVWQIADTPNAFYQVVDVNLVNDGTAPVETVAAPTNVLAKALSDSSITVNWNASAKAASYEVFRNGTLINTTTATTLQDAGLTASTVYTYTVRAIDAAGKQSALSQPATATTLATNGGGNSTLPAWDAKKVYVKGDKVQYNGVEYTAAYWTQGNTPDSSDAWQANSGGAVSQEWNSKKAYTGGSKVTFNGVTYEAKWWTQGEEPGKANVWKAV